MLIPFGILSSAGALREGTYELISTTVLASTTASVTFSNLGDYASTYKHLQIRVVSRTNRAADNLDTVVFRLNADTGSNYAWHHLIGNGSTVTSAAGTTQTGMHVTITSGSTSTANAFGGSVIDILDAYATKNKTLRSSSGLASNSSRVYLNSGVWLNTASTTSITLLSNSGSSFITGSRFSLYGIRG